MAADDRQAALREALELSKEWSDRLLPMQNWLDQAEKFLERLENVPTDEQRIREQIEAQKVSELSTFLFRLGMSRFFL